MKKVLVAEVVLLSPINKPEKLEAVTGKLTFAPCPACDGKGEIEYDMPSYSETWTCRDCNGEGLTHLEGKA